MPDYRIDHPPGHHNEQCYWSPSSLHSRAGHSLYCNQSYRTRTKQVAVYVYYNKVKYVIFFTEKYKCNCEGDVTFAPVQVQGAQFEEHNHWGMRTPRHTSDCVGVLGIRGKTLFVLDHLSVCRLSHS